MKRKLPLLIVLLALGLGAAGYLAIDRYGLPALISLISVYGAALIIFAESGLLIGFFLPGDSLLFTLGFLIQQNILAFNINWLVFLLFVAAATGDSAGYAFGHKVGRQLFKRKNSLLFHRDNLQRAEEFYQKHGGKTIIIARFIPVVRTFAPIVAGISSMPYRTFLAFNLIGGLAWTASLTYLGYFAGVPIEASGVNVEYVILAIIFLSLLPPVIHILREPAVRRYLAAAVRHLFSK